MSSVHSVVRGAKGEALTVELAVYERCGIIRGARVGAHLQAWIKAAHKVGRFPSIHEAARALDVADRNGARSRKIIRSAFSEEEFRLLVEQALANYNAKDPLRSGAPGWWS